MFKHSLFLVSLFCALSLTTVNANPMRPDSAVVSTTSNTTQAKPKAKVTVQRLPSLKSVVVIGSFRLANFSNKTDVKVGDSISGYRLIQIEPTYVLLERNSTVKRIDLNEAGSLDIRPNEEGK